MTAATSKHIEVDTFKTATGWVLPFVCSLFVELFFMETDCYTYYREGGGLESRPQTDFGAPGGSTFHICNAHSVRSICQRSAAKFMHLMCDNVRCNPIWIPRYTRESMFICSYDTIYISDHKHTHHLTH